MCWHALLIILCTLLTFRDFPTFSLLFKKKELSLHTN